jgi:hypothetical protein
MLLRLLPAQASRALERIRSPLLQPEGGATLSASVVAAARSAVDRLSACLASLNEAAESEEMREVGGRQTDRQADGQAGWRQVGCRLVWCAHRGLQRCQQASATARLLGRAVHAMYGCSVGSKYSVVHVPIGPCTSYSNAVGRAA